MVEKRGRPKDRDREPEDFIFIPPPPCITFALCIPKLFVPWYKSFMSLLLTEYNTAVGRCGGIPYRRRILCQVFWARSVRSEGVIWYGFTQGLSLKNTAQNDWRFLHGKSGEEKYQVKKKSLLVAIQSAFWLRQGNEKRNKRNRGRKHNLTYLKLIYCEVSVTFRALMYVRTFVCVCVVCECVCVSCVSVCVCVCRVCVSVCGVCVCVCVGVCVDV